MSRSKIESPPLSSYFRDRKRGSQENFFLSGPHDLDVLFKQEQFIPLMEGRFMFEVFYWDRVIFVNPALSANFSKVSPSCQKTGNVYTIFFGGMEYDKDWIKIGLN